MWVRGSDYQKQCEAQQKRGFKQEEDLVLLSDHRLHCSHLYSNRSAHQHSQPSVPEHRPSLQPHNELLFNPQSPA